MRSLFVLIAVAAAAVVALILVESAVALAIVLTDGLIAAMILALAAIPGTLLLRLVQTNEKSFACRVIFGAGIGAGLLCLLEFTLGVCGALSRGWWLAAFGTVLLVSLIAYAPAMRRLAASNASWTLPAIEPRHWLWLAVVPFAALALIVATAPPGVLWPAEGNGYDVLEYHLAVPKQSYDAGHILFLPNNAYSNFPFNAEMLYLLAMVLKSGAIEGIMLAQMFNAALAFLFVAAMWAAARPFGSTPALAAALLAGTCGWLVYLSGVAYVENAMLLFTALAFAAWVRWASSSSPVREGEIEREHEATDSLSVASPADKPPVAPGQQAPADHNPWALLAGLFVGLACGCKYTAIVLVAVPLALMFVSSRIALTPSLSPGERGGILRSLTLYALGILVTFAPWLLKNAVFCGNPVFPQATAVLGYRPGIWDEECEERWARGHLPPPELRSLAGRLRATWHAVIAEPLTVPAIWLLAVSGFALNARRHWPLVLVILLQIVLWAGLTHLADRFAVPILPPLVLLAAMAVARSTVLARRQHRLMIATCALVLLGAVANLYHVGGLYYDRTRFRTAGGRIETIPWQGQVQWFVEGQWPGTAPWGFINRDLPPSANVLLVADARSLYVLRKCDYSVVFNPDPFAEAIRKTGDAVGVLAWLRKSGYTHVYVDWTEMRRLRATYGFRPEINEELFTRLEKAGLQRLKDFAFGENERPYGTIYEVRP